MFMEYIYCLMYVTGLSVCIYKYLDRKPKRLEFICLLLIYAFFNFIITNKMTFHVLEQLFMTIGVFIIDFIMISIMNRKINISFINYIVFYNIIYSFIISFSLFFMNNYLPLLIDKTHHETFYRCTFVIFLNLLTVFIWCVLEKKNILVNKSVNKNYFRLFLIVNIISCIILVIFQYYSYTIHLDIYINIVLIIFSILWFYLINIINRYASISYEHENMLLKESISHTIDQYMIQYKDNQEKINKFRHDIKNHFILIKEMKDSQEINNYIDKIYPELENIKISDDVISGHLYIDAIINSRKLMYEDVHFIGEFIGLKNLKMNEIDLSSLLFNLLDNAFQAAYEMKGYVKLELKYDDKHFIVRVENSCKEKTNFKSKRKNHGYGLKIVNDVIEKYNGHIEMVSTDNQVVIKVGLYVA